MFSISHVSSYPLTDVNEVEDKQAERRVDYLIKDLQYTYPQARSSHYIPRLLALAETSTTRSDAVRPTIFTSISFLSRK